MLYLCICIGLFVYLNTASEPLQRTSNKRRGFHIWSSFVRLSSNHFVFVLDLFCKESHGTETTSWSTQWEYKTLEWNHIIDHGQPNGNIKCTFWCLNINSGKICAKTTSRDEFYPTMGIWKFHKLFIQKYNLLEICPKLHFLLLRTNQIRFVQEAHGGTNNPKGICTTM